jgi:predicted membrane chloride channel (bestrophin family)
MTIYGMASRVPYPDGPLSGLEASRRVAWAKFYEERDHSGHLAAMNAVLVERVETLVPEFLDLIDSVLSARNIEAFAHAYRCREIIRDFMEGPS